jgi:anti-sigma regulatory factor (Ser/Thr protein kinase)
MTGTATRLELSLHAEPSSVREARDAVAQAALDIGLSPRRVEDIRLCVSEAVANVVRHAYVHATGDVLVTLDPLERGVLVVVRDFGTGTSTMRPPARDDGGFGLKIVQSLADGCTVTSTPEDGTEVWMSFGASPRASALRTSRSRQ